MSRADEGRGDRRVREEVRLQADGVRVAVDGLGRLRQQGQPDRAAHAAAGRRDLLEDAQARRQGHHDLGRARPDRRRGRRSRSASTAATRPRAPTATSRSTRSCKGDYKDTVKEQPGSASVVQGVTEDKFGIGYSGIGYRTSGVQAADARRRRTAQFFTDRRRRTSLRQVSALALPLRLRQHGARTSRSIPLRSGSS